jgi:isopentenyl-diphosphate delta-isomerase
LEGRVLIKETGAGMSPETLNQLKTISARYIDVSGAGGTSWTKVEMHRAADSQLKQIGRTFSDWGVPTAFSIIAARKILDDKACLIASGGIFTGLDVARAIAAGADMAGFARTALLAFLAEGTEGAIELIDRIKQELVRAMLLTGCKNIAMLREAPRVYTAELKNWLEAYDWFGGKRN